MYRVIDFRKRNGTVREAAVEGTAVASIADVLTELGRGAASERPDLRARVAEIIATVRERGDAALAEYTARFDGVDVPADGLKVSEEEIEAAVAGLDPELYAAMQAAGERIRRFHSAQMAAAEDVWQYGSGSDPGSAIRLGWLTRPLRRVGIYVPGGTAPLFSSVLMNAIPAVVAGVAEIVMCAPPGRDGRIPAVTLAAARVAGVDKVFVCGGAQAIAAMAYGTATIPACDKIVGPGNAYVAEAKRQVYGQCAIDMIAGPSEVMIVADRSADPAYIAADLLAQAEHDPQAQAILVSNEPELVEAVQAELARQLPLLPRSDIAVAALANSAAVLVYDLETALELVNAYAPEHLELQVEPEKRNELLPRINNAGAVFMGAYSVEALGDYWAGTNHVLPTGGTARFSSGLSVLDFLRRMSVIDYSGADLSREGAAVVCMAAAEGLEAHANSIRLRLVALRASADAADPTGGDVATQGDVALPTTDSSAEGKELWSELALSLTPYIPGEQPSAGEVERIIKLNTNELPFSPSPRVLAALADFDGESLRRYPDYRAAKLRVALADLENSVAAATNSAVVAEYARSGKNDSDLAPLTAENIFVGNGSDEVLAFAFAAFGRPAAGPILLADPGYSFYPVYADYNRLPVSYVGPFIDRPVDVCGFDRPGSMVVLANPNAPTGAGITLNEVEHLVTYDPQRLVLIDEAYVDFGGETAAPLVGKYNNLLVVKTFSKSRGLAGLRLGYAIGAPQLIAALVTIRDSFNSYTVGSIVQTLGIAAAEDREWWRAANKQIMTTRAEAVAELTALGFAVVPSQTNFIWARYAGEPKLGGREIFTALRAKNIWVRYFSRPELADYLRITIGTAEEMAALYRALGEIIKEKKNESSEG